MAVLAGRLSLSIEGREAIAVCPDTPPVFSPGDVAASAEPVGAAVTDLNVMTRRGSFESRLSRRLLQGPASLTLRAQTTLILALSALALRCQAGRADLPQLDAALLERAQVRSPAARFARRLLSHRAPGLPARRIRAVAGGARHFLTSDSIRVSGTSHTSATMT
jgi:environmental stress-induced protein Ves